MLLLREKIVRMAGAKSVFVFWVYILPIVGVNYCFFGVFGLNCAHGGCKIYVLIVVCFCGVPLQGPKFINAH